MSDTQGHGLIKKQAETIKELKAALQPFYEYIKRPTQPILAVIRSEEWDAVFTIMKKLE